MTKLTLKADPTFSVVVDIPQLGKEPQPVRFTFKHRTQEQLSALLNSNLPDGEARSDEDVVLEIADGWELKEKFTAANIRTFCQHFHGAATAIVKAYLREFAKARLGN